LRDDRKILKDIYFYITSIKIISNDYFFPFLNNPYIAQISLKFSYIQEIINSYNALEKNEMEKNKDR
jgi:hypothetical protein